MYAPFVSLALSGVPVIAREDAIEFAAELENAMARIRELKSVKNVTDCRHEALLGVV